MARGHVLKGKRYIRTPDNEALARFIVDKLHYLDWQEAREFYAKVVPTLDPNGVALLGCNDRYFLLTVLLARPDAARAAWLYDRAREVEADPDNFLDLWSREHYKSTIITFAGIIQEILIDPEITIGIFSETRDISLKFVDQIKTELERNETLQSLYPDVLWNKEELKNKRITQKWSINDGFVVRRTTNPKERTVEGHSLSRGMPAGRHFRLRVYDDVVTERCTTNPEMNAKITVAWELSDNLGGGEKRKWHIGTRYSFADTYGHILSKNLLKARVYPATDNGKVTGSPVLFTAKEWAEKVNTQRSTLAAQLLQNPLGDKEQVFRPEWLTPWYARPRILNVYITCDPSKGRSKKADRTAMVVIGIDPAGNKYLLDGYRHRMGLTERWDRLKGLYLKWSREVGVQIVRVGYEVYGIQTDVEYFQERMRLEGLSFPIEELNWSRDTASQSKRDRVERLEPDLRRGRFLVPAVVWEPPFKPTDRPDLLVDKDGKPVVGKAMRLQREANSWAVDEDKGCIVTKPITDGSYIPKELTELLETGQQHRMAKPIIRKDEDSKPYDLTKAFWEEALFFPFGTHDDLIDAASRIYDMQPTAPSVHETPERMARRTQKAFADA